MYLYTGLAFVVLVAIILFTPFRIILRYRLLQGDDDLHVEIVWLGMRLVRLQVPVLFAARSSLDNHKHARDEVEASHGSDGTGSLPHKAMGWRRLVQEIKTIGAIEGRYQAVFDALYIFAYGKSPGSCRMPLGQPILGYLAALVYPFTRHFERLHWYTRIGLGDAAATAVAVGALSGLKAAGFSWLQQRVHLDSNKIRWQVSPNYSARQVDMAIDCILRVNAGHIIITGVTNFLRFSIVKAFDGKTQ
ncbi:MAG: DUF2953 domain-containing protein [Firmicutes bacterium]|nr:DUF2953 domain-containing protein [Bacillota bacterium]